MKKYILYILRTNENTLYTGITNDLKKRMEKHRSGKGAKYLRKFDSFELVLCEKYETKSEALKREVAVKRMTKKEKEVLVYTRICHGKKVKTK